MSDDTETALARILRGVPAKDCETSTLDFKEDAGSRDDLLRVLVKASVCFANTAGGTVVLGVADKPGGREAIKGTDWDSEHLRQRIYENTNPKLLVDIETRLLPARLLIIRIRTSAAVHCDNQGRSWQRVNKDCLPLTPAEQARIVDERRGYDWSAESSGRSILDADRNAFFEGKRLVRNLTDERSRLAELEEVDFFSALGVLADRRSFNRAGELLFCDKAAGMYDAILYQYRLTPGGEPRNVQRLPFPLIAAYSRARELISARQNTTPVTLPSGQQITIEDFPDAALREALSNAICHRDWRASGLVDLDHSPEILVVTSPGPLVSGVTPENILTVSSNPRNPTLAKAVRMLGLAEETGRGVDRMFRETIRAGKKLPKIEGSFSQVRVSFTGGAPDTNIARFVASLPREEQDDTDTMLIVFYLCQSRTVTAAQATTLLQKGSEEVGLILKRLSAEHVALIEPTRESAARKLPTYRLRGEVLRGLGAAVVYGRRTVDDIDRKVLAHVKEYGRITNRTLQNFLDVPMLKARDILSDLSQRGMLVIVSSQTRGSKVEWGPGPKFMTARPKREAKAETPDQAELPLIPKRKRSATNQG